MTLVEKARALDAQIEAAGGLGPFWIEDQKARRDRGEPYYARLVDPATGELIAEWNDRQPNQHAKGGRDG